MTKILILIGPNLNMVGIREPEIYGSETQNDTIALCEEKAQELSFEIDFRQSNHEGELITWIQQARNVFDGLIINAGAYTHTSIAIHDALRLLEIPIVEVHLSDPAQREEFRHHSYIEPLATQVIKGQGAQGYARALAHLSTILEN